MKYKYLIVDDEPFARKLILSHASKIEGLELVAECVNAIEAADLVRGEKIDLIFLDIQMPELTGLDFIKTLTNPPSVILTTAHRDFAPEAFDLDVIDYLLKPISLERLLKAVNKFFDNRKAGFSQLNPVPLEESFIYLKADRKTHKVLLDEIRFIESLDDYVKVHFTDRILITRENISTLEVKLPDQQFVRIHRSFIVSVKSITSLTAEGIEIGGKELPFGRAYKKSALALLGFKQL